ncbi:hypothetical protein RRG08_059919 [Elysia crispata]|uniref:Uncharacterized protein n=1 Tax=Elysia crispata TaxID=231223 RepID=A0AAE1CTX4_9GAST|nr:hypothetical protein RRG08_059919 [Elysia crispata]
MADITLRLIWYKLGEVSEKMAEAGRTWYTELDFDSYVLDLLLLSWCAASIVVILVVNAVVSAFGPLQKQPKDWDSRGREPREGESLTGAPLPIESAKWFNNALNWFYLHYYYSPEFVEDWLKSLNEQLLRLGLEGQSYGGLALLSLQVTFYHAFKSTLSPSRNTYTFPIKNLPCYFSFVSDAIPYRVPWQHRIRVSWQNTTCRR